MEKIRKIFRSISHYSWQANEWLIKAGQRLGRNTAALVVVAVLLAGGFFYGGYIAGSHRHKTMAKKTNFKTVATRAAETASHSWVYHGNVTAISSTNLTIKVAADTKALILDANTHIAGAARTVTFKDIKVGDQVIVSGKTTSDGKLLATTVHMISAPSIPGK